MVEKTWYRFKTILAEEYNDQVEEIKVTTGDAGFHSDNAMQEIRGALEHLAMVAGDNKEIVTKLPEAVEQLSKNNSYRRKYVSYGRIILYYIPQKEEPFRTRLTVGGNLIVGYLITTTADITTAKLIANSTIHTPG